MSRPSPVSWDSEPMSAQPLRSALHEPLREPLAEPRRFRLRVPATSANLGPGYDSMGVALGLYDVVDVVASPRARQEHAEISVTVEGQGAGSLPEDASHLVVSLIEQILSSQGYRLPDLQVAAQNSIPHSRGLGSSAAAAATAVVTASHLLPEGLSEDEQLQIGARIEGHPDNYVPALRGGLALSWQTGPAEAPRFRTAPLGPHADLRLVLAVPDLEQSTHVARTLLPARIPHADAAHNSARSGLLVHALTTDPTLLLEATEDRLHQEYRRSAFPASMRLVDALRAEGHPAVISGAGPSVLVLAAGDQAAVASCELVASRSSGAGEAAFTPKILPLSPAGATVEEYTR